VRFAENAALLCGHCALLFGWRPDEFWRMTPAELQSVIGALPDQNDVPPDAALFAKLKQQFPDSKQAANSKA